MGVHLTTTIRRVDVNTGLVEGTSDEEVAGSLEELDTGEGASRDDTGTMAWLGAEGDGLGLLVTNQAVRIGRAPDAEVF